MSKSALVTVLSLFKTLTNVLFERALGFLTRSFKLVHVHYHSGICEIGDVPLVGWLVNGVISKCVLPTK